MSARPLHIAIFASGQGTNAANLVHHFKENPAARIALIVCNNPKAGVLAMAKAENIPVLLLPKTDFTTGETVVNALKNSNIDFIVLAGFLLKIPPALVAAFPKRIINLHPALLPKFGGAGMYGRHVFAAVIAARETESGITIHYVDEFYDHGQIIFQSRFTVLPEDDAESLTRKTQELEHRHFPRITEELVRALPAQV